MFEMFTDRARRVVVLALEEARLLDHNYIGTEHILLGLVYEGEGVAARVLESLGISREAVRQQVEEMIGQGLQPPSGHVPFTAGAKKALELSRRETTQLGRNHIDTEHLLLGLLGEPKSVGVRILINLGADPAVVRQQVIQMLPDRHSQRPGPAVGPSQLRARFGSRESAVSQDRIVGALTAIGDRLTAIERRLGISRQSPPGPFDEQIAELRRAKEAAIDSRDFEQAAALRDQEKRLIAQQEASGRGPADRGQPQ